MWLTWTGHVKVQDLISAENWQKVTKWLVPPLNSTIRLRRKWQSLSLIQVWVLTGWTVSAKLAASVSFSRKLTANTAHLLSLFLRLASSSSCDAHNKQAEARAVCVVVGATPSECTHFTWSQFFYTRDCVSVISSFPAAPVRFPGQSHASCGIVWFLFLSEQYFLLSVVLYNFYCRLPCKSISNQFAGGSKQGQTNCDISPPFMAINTNL